MDKIKVLGVVDTSNGIEGIFKSFEAIRNSARLRGENVENMCTVGFSINNYDDDPEPAFKFYDDGHNSYLVALNRQVNQDVEEVKEIYKQLRKIIDENPMYAKGGMTLELLRELIKKGK